MPKLPMRFKISEMRIYFLDLVLGFFRVHGDFTEVFIVVGVPWVLKIQYTLSP